MPFPPRSPDSDEISLAAAVASRTAHVVHLTHNDLDAVGADAVHRIKFGGGVFTIWSSVGRFPAIFLVIASCRGNGDLLSISDLGYHREIERTANRARENGWRIEWRDHHRWQDEEVARVKKEVAALTIDTSVCATGIVASDLLPGNAIAAEIARVVCDYDLWRHHDSRSAVIGQVLQRKKNRDHVRDSLVQGIFTDDFIKKEYADIKAEMEGILKRSLKHTAIVNTKYRIAFAPLYGYPSETAHFIREKKKTDIEVIVGRDGRFSLRSVPPISHLIAREFSGGGHPNAAGGSFNFTVIERFIFWLFKKSRHFDEFVKVAESK
jgi:oligoribonuclease NrnB/cAMP/cGMP phosphodiesterase (DHH superfamily)